MILRVRWTRGLRWIVLALVLALVIFISYSKSEENYPRPGVIPSTCKSTIVSAYYNISSKHSPAEYVNWMTNFLSLQDCLVVFTSKDLEHTIRNLRTPGFPIRIVPRSLDSFYVAKLLNDTGWEVQESLDPELEVGHSRELYWIWNEKSAMLKYVSETNPFSSEYFAWLDIGAIRHSRWNGRVLMQNLPEEAGILLLQVGEFEDSELVLKDGLSHSDFFQKNRIGGGMIGGSAESVRIWADLFYKTIKRYFSLNRFGGKDQSVMATTCLESDVCLLLDGSPAHPWFYNEPRWFRLQNYYLGDLSQQPSRMNLSAVERTL